MKKELILYPHVSEKDVKLLDENKLAFIVDKRTTKPEIKEEIKKLFGAEVADVWIQNNMKGKKKAIVKFKDETVAADIATKLGVL